ncbi:MAG: CBS domain-containing protein [Candidatus Pacearchaeota archaeon]
MKNILVSDLMTREPLIANPNDKILDCAKKMVKKKVGSLILVNKKKLVGFLSEKDILWAIVKKSKKDLAETKAIDISPKKIITIRPNATIREAISKMNKTKFERLPVVIKNNEVVGMITARDILNFHPEFYPEFEEFARIREETEKLKKIKRIKGFLKEGICQECGEKDFLYKMNGRYLCESCKELV